MKIVSIEHLEKGFQYKRMNTIYNNSTLKNELFMKYDNKNLNPLATNFGLDVRNYCFQT